MSGWALQRSLRKHRDAKIICAAGPLLAQSCLDSLPSNYSAMLPISGVQTQRWWFGLFRDADPIWHTCLDNVSAKKPPWEKDMELSSLKPAETTQADELLIRMQHRLPSRGYAKRELQKFVEMFLIANVELAEMRGEVTV